jgi:citrate lyase beta subunit
VIEQARRAARLDAASALHRADRPGASPEEIEHAERLVAAFETAETEGRDRIEVDGQIAERPSYLNARALLERIGRG